MDPRKLPKDVWEALCTKCGKCCTEKVEIDGRLYQTKKYCRFLDPATKLCRVYERRFEAEPTCSSIEDGIPLGLFPSDCPYIQDIENYVPVVEVWDDPAIDAAIRELLGDDAV